jgi:hypothetical protein
MCGCPVKLLNSRSNPVGTFHKTKKVKKKGKKGKKKGKKGKKKGKKGKKKKGRRRREGEEGKKKKKKGNFFPFFPFFPFFFFFFFFFSFFSRACGRHTVNHKTRSPGMHLQTHVRSKNNGTMNDMHKHTKASFYLRRNIHAKHAADIILDAKGTAIHCTRSLPRHRSLR